MPTVQPDPAWCTAPTRIGIHSGPQNIGLTEYVSLWHEAEAMGLDWASVFDHFMPIEADPTGPCFEGPTLLSALAASTSRITCGLLVAGNPYRHPAVLANIAMTIDHISHGRLEFGVGAGWYELEHDQYGIVFEPFPDRAKRLAESATILQRLWTEETVNYEGAFYSLREARCEPKPIRGAIPLWIGAAGEVVMLRIVARMAHGWNTFLLPTAEYQLKASALEQHCRAIDRDPETIRRSLIFQAVIRETEADLADGVEWLARVKGVQPEVVRSSALVGTPDQVASKLDTYRALGVADFLLAARPPVDHETFRLVGTQVAPELRRSK